MGNNIETSTKYANTVEINSKFTKEGNTSNSTAAKLIEKMKNEQKGGKKS